MNTILAKAVAFDEALQPGFKEYARAVIANAQELASQLEDRGFKLVFGGTDNHLILIDMVASKGINGKIAEEALDKVGLTANKNSIPDDELPPFAPSGLRIGTPALSARGLRLEHMSSIASWIEAAIEARNNTSELRQIRETVAGFMTDFPLPS